MTDKGSIVTNYKMILKGTHTVRGARDLLLEAVGKGDVEVVTSHGKTLVFKDVLFMPDLKVNLFSVSKATNSGFEVVCPNDEVKFHKKKEMGS